MTENKTIKGDVWIQGNSLVQEQILLVPGKDCYYNTIVLIDNIWDDLLSEGTYHDNGKGYFYWDITMTDTENDDSEITVKYECPRPKENLFKEPYDPETKTGAYAKYWVGKLKTAQENYENKAAIQRKEIVFPGSNYVNQNGESVKVEDIKFSNGIDGDITNLLNLF